MRSCASSIMKLWFLLLCCYVARATASCLGNSTSLNSTTPCLVGALLPAYRPQSVFPSPYPHYVNEFYGQRPSPQVAFQPHHASYRPVLPNFQTDYDPYFRPNDAHSNGYTYPAGYRGPEWTPYHSQYHQQPISQPPIRYSIGGNHPNLSPVFQRRTYLANSQSHSTEPIFMDRGTVTFVGRDVELTCAFYDSRFRIVSVSLSSEPLSSLH